MKGKSWQIPVNTSKYSCSCCGGKLITEKTHRVVTKEDKDYFRYQRYNTFPRVDHDVYGFEYKCTSCGNYTSFDEQKIIHKLQKTHKSKILSSEQIKKYMPAAKYKHIKSRLWRNILVNIIGFLILGILLIVNGDFMSDTKNVAVGAVLWIASFIYSVLFTVKRFSGTFKMRMLQGYSFEEEMLFDKLHSSTKHNRELIDKSNMCYCYHCKKSFLSQEVKEYSESNDSAICPNCNNFALIPDAADDKISMAIVNQMHDYWL